MSLHKKVFSTLLTVGLIGTLASPSFAAVQHTEAEEKQTTEENLIAGKRHGRKHHFRNGGRKWHKKWHRRHQRIDNRQWRRWEINQRRWRRQWKNHHKPWRHNQYWNNHWNNKHWRRRKHSVHKQHRFVRRTHRKFHRSNIYWDRQYSYYEHYPLYQAGLKPFCYNDDWGRFQDRIYCNYNGVSYWLPYNNQYGYYEHKDNTGKRIFLGILGNVVDEIIYQNSY